LYARLRPKLEQNGLELDASYDGHALGDTARVRVFPVESIKGLEFEAVFYVGLDKMEEVHKDLLDKYVYVGLSRARSFLAATYERQFPARLKAIPSETRGPAQALIELEGGERAFQFRRHRYAIPAGSH